MPNQMPFLWFAVAKGILPYQKYAIISDTKTISPPHTHSISHKLEQFKF